MEKSNYISGIVMISLINRLRNGEKVECTSCKEGFYEPANGSDFKIAHCFRCKHCGEMINID